MNQQLGPSEKMEQIIQELHIANQTIKSKQHGSGDEGSLEWDDTRNDSTAALCEKTLNVWLGLGCLNRWRRSL